MFYLVTKAILDDKNVDLSMVKKRIYFAFRKISWRKCWRFLMIVSILGVEKVFNDVLNSKQTILDEKNVHL